VRNLGVSLFNSAVRRRNVHSKKISAISRPYLNTFVRYKIASFPYRAFLFFSTGAGAEEGPEAAYRREEELELARKGTENVFDPEGILDDDEDMEISTDDKETQTRNL
jgi:hypothetical protein